MTSITDKRWLTHSTEEIYDNPWITLTHRHVSAPTGKQGIYGVVHFKNTAIGVIPIDAEGYTWLVGQHRYTLDQYEWEIPEGGALIGESSLAAAQRELREETGIVARRWTSLLKLNTSNSVTDEVARVFLAQDLSFGETEPDDTELLQLRRIPLDDAINMALDGSIADSVAMSALLKLGLLLDRGVLSI
ncbi:NUDIX domain-containing protein [Granulosicoccus antarcticus]|uniref:GDP-mannose pyrophosphatase n=1 Tax=Granulosicoccus antarcticus IMCC3135 TaxID=1192854 RepID=A0A2Z2P188_9GAMM|nr:NUDIX hydrolase [Granulosicoccus antarcticus]ASJ76261.1 ADP-ribose pyrophosphatase [Granulosicoccus antarcticus IMCC3135]